MSKQLVGCCGVPLAFNPLLMAPVPCRETKKAGKYRLLDLQLHPLVI